MSMKNFNDTIGNRTRDLPACSAVPQPTAPPRTQMKNVAANFGVKPAKSDFARTLFNGLPLKPFIPGWTPGTCFPEI